MQATNYIYDTGNTNIILHGRGIRTFETTTRNIVDINTIADIQHCRHLNSAEALSDGHQALTGSMFAQLMQELKPFVEAAGRTL
ncbi:hypothetical protein A1OQ_21240 [Enterovibrio norvegicus FF-162]|nr:hypothetical protein [Enterovibrio norvegicus]OEE79702.1 hypothetical protein A1OQ_21240 [Enterovibrio norvegicus FF-162]